MITKLHTFMVAHQTQICLNPNDYIMWCGNFNRHHPLWDKDEDEHLFMNEATHDAEYLISQLAEWNMEMPLPKGILTLKHMVTKLYSCPDNIFCMDILSEHVIKCNTLPNNQPPRIDHFPMVMVHDLPTQTIVPKPSLDYRIVDW